MITTCAVLTKEGILGLHKDIGQLFEDQVGLALRMTGFKAQACHCGDNGGHLSNMLYEEPLVASEHSNFFHGGQSPSPVPIPPLPAQILAADVPIPSLGSSSSDKENSSIGSFQSAQQVVGELAKIMEADLEVDDEDAWVLLDTMDAEVRSHLFQCCKSKKHPQCFAPFPKGWQAD